MGRPYADEIQALPRTFEFARDLDLTGLTHTIAQCRELPLVPIGSGGSSTAAHFAAALHTRAFGLIARPMTPLDAVVSLRRPASIASLLLTAGGGNPDVLGVFHHLLQLEPQRCLVL